jgi:hypothetical protein
LVASLIVLIFGAGKFSLDTLFNRLLGRQAVQQSRSNI